MSVPEMIRIFFTSTLLKAGTHDRAGVRAAFFPVFGETLLILNLPCQLVFVRSGTDSGRRKPCAKKEPIGIGPSNQTQGDVPGGRNVSGAPPGGSAPWAPSTGKCSLRRLARASRPPWRRRKDAAEYHPEESARA